MTTATKTTAHTPGPWETVRVTKRGNANAWRIRQAAPRYPHLEHMSEYHLLVADLHAHRFGSADSVPGDTMRDLAHSDKEGCQEANARLIAAAPDLLEACQAAAEMLANVSHYVPDGEFESEPNVNTVRDQLAKVIAKATAAST